MPRGVFSLLDHRWIACLPRTGMFWFRLRVEFLSSFFVSFCFVSAFQYPIPLARQVFRVTPSFGYRF